jgi:hypothetical protein
VQGPFPLAGSVQPVAQGIDLDSDAALFVDSWGQITPLLIRVTGWIRQVDGDLAPWVELVNAPVLTTRTRRIFPIGPGRLEYIGVEAIGSAVTYGGAYVRVSLARRAGTESFTWMLAQGYVGGGLALGWPDVGPPGPGLDFGAWLHTEPGLPPVGTELVVELSSSEDLEIGGLSFRLVTSAAVAARNVNVVLEDAVNNKVLSLSLSPQTQAASLTYRYGVVSNLQAVARQLGNDVLLDAPLRLSGPQIQLRTVTVALQAGDQFSGLSIYARRALRVPI